jgi:hypothetical protein
LRLIQRLQADGDIAPEFVFERWPGGVDRLLPLLQRALPELPAPVLALRLRLAIDTLLRSLAHDSFTSGQLDAHVCDLLDFLTGALEAPVTGERAP